MNFRVNERAVPAVNDPPIALIIISKFDWWIQPVPSSNSSNVSYTSATRLSTRGSRFYLTLSFAREKSQIKKVRRSNYNTCKRLNQLGPPMFLVGLFSFINNFRKNRGRTEVFRARDSSLKLYLRWATFNIWINLCYNAKLSTVSELKFSMTGFRCISASTYCSMGANAL